MHLPKGWGSRGIELVGMGGETELEMEEKYRALDNSSGAWLSRKDTVLLYSSRRALDSSVISTHWSCGVKVW